MLYFIVFTAVFSFAQPHEGVASFSHDHHEDSQEIEYSGVEKTQVDDVKDLPEFVRLRFFWNSQKFDLNLTQTQAFSSADFDIHYTVLEDGSSHVDGDDITGTVMFTDWKISKVFEAYLHSDGVRYEFKPAHYHEELKKEYHTIGNSTRFMQSRRRLINEFTDCWPNQANTVLQTEIGYIVDPDFSAAAIAKRQAESGTPAQKVQAEVTSINDAMNEIYRAQFGIMMVQQPIWDQQGLFPDQFPTAAPTGGFTLGCNVYGKGAGQLAIDTYLENLQAWRQTTKPQENGEWQILTNCFPPPGTIGIAYLRAVCTDYGVGVNTFTNRGTSQTWLTVAHEVGHNIGAGHSFEEGQGTTGGIMDYGDGMIDNAFQFNEKFRRNDICGTLSATMAGAGTVQNCWKPRKPLAGEISYEWVRKTGTSAADSVSECLPAKAKLRLKTTLYVCNKLQGQGGTPATSIYTEEPDSTKCDLGQKPMFGETHTYTGGCEPDVSKTCGNSILEYDEECEPGLVQAGAQSCCVECAWLNTAACAPLKTSVDAAFLWNNALYLFQGTQVYRYTGSATVKPWNNGPDAGYPRAITTNFPGLAQETLYNANVDSALVKPGSSELLIFKGLTALRYDLTTNAKIGALDLTAASTTTFSDCGTIQASLAFTDSMWLMCESVVQIMSYTTAVISVNFLPDFDFVFPATVQSSIEAAAHDDVTGETVFFNGGYTMQWKARTHVGGAAAQMAGLGTGTPPINTPTGPTPTGNPGTAAPAPPANSQCADMCATCDPDTPNICRTCRTIPTTPIPGGYCLGDNVVTYLGFDSNSKQQDAQHVKGGTATLNGIADNRYTQGLAAVFGSQTTSGLSFNGFQKLEMASLDAKGVNWAPNEKMRVTAFYKPNPISVDEEGNLPMQRFITFKDTNGIPLLSVDFSVEPQCNPPQTTGTGCQCVAKQDARYPSITYPAECQYGNENARPYCYVSAGCSSAIDGRDLLGPTGNKILLCSGSDCTATNGQNSGSATKKQMKLEVKTPSGEFNCFVNAPLTVGEWNQLYFEFGSSTFVTGVGGLRHSRAFDIVNGDPGTNMAANAITTFQIGEWEIGANAGGINGVVDHFQLTLGEPTASTGANSIGGDSESASDGGAIAAGVVVPLLLIAMIAFACYYYWDEIMEKYNKQGSSHKAGAVPLPPVARNLQEPGPQTRKTGMSFDISRTEQNVEWYYVLNGAQAGPLTEAIFMSRVGAQIQRDTLVWNGTTVKDWVPAQDVPQLKFKFEGGTTSGSTQPTTADTLWNYVGPDGSNIGPITETVLLGMNLPGDTYVWNGSSVNEWSYLSDTYLSGLQI